jgi:hypothetical protein
MNHSVYIKAQNVLTRLLWVVAVTIGLLSCDEGEDDADIDLPTALISKAWVPGSIALDNVDITGFSYQSLVLTYEIDGSWTCAGGNDLFGTSGTWSYKINADQSTDYSTLVMSGVEIVVSLNEQGTVLELTIDFTGTSPIAGRVGSTTGKYFLRLVPKFAPGGN